MRNFRTFTQIAKQTIAERRMRSIDNICVYGIDILDRYLGGILENELVVIGASPGVGKTEVSCQIAIANAMRGKKVALLSLEGDIGEVVYRYFQRKINEGKESNFIKPQDYRLNLGDFSYAEDKVMNNLPPELDNLFIFDKEFIPDKVKLLELIKDIRHECDIIIIDHLHYLDYDIRNEFGEISDIVRSIKETTEIIKKPVVLVSHLRRMKLADGELPTKSDLHGSSNIEKNANTVILITPGDNEEYIDGFSNKEDKFLRKTRIILDKSRVGIPTPSIFDTTFDLRTKTYLTGEKYNGISDHKTNRITVFDRIKKDGDTED